MDIDAAINTTNTEAANVDMVMDATSSDSDSSSSSGSSSTSKGTLRRRIMTLEADLLEVTNDLYVPTTPSG